MRTVLVMIFFLFAAGTYPVVTFRMAVLKRLSEELRISFPAMRQAGMELDSVSSFRGKPLHARTDRFGDVCHIGYRLFDPNVGVEDGRRTVFDFVERYFLELDLGIGGHTPAVRMDLDWVVFKEGNPGMVREITPDTPFMLDEYTRKAYRLSWNIGKKRVVLEFPADCQLLVGANVIELEEMLIRDIRRTTPAAGDEAVRDWEQTPTVRSGDMWIVENGTYLSKMICGDIYLVELAGKKSLLCSPAHTSRSISNMMLTGDFRHVVGMNLAMDVSNREKPVNIRTTLQQVISCFKAEGCKLFFGVKTKTEDRLTGTLFAYHEGLAYNHVLSVDVPLALLEGKDVSVEAILYAYVPLHDVTEKFFNQM